MIRPIFARSYFLIGRAARVPCFKSRNSIRLVSTSTGTTESIPTPTSLPTDSQSVPISDTTTLSTTVDTNGVSSRIQDFAADGQAGSATSLSAYSLEPILGSIQGGIEAVHDATALPWWATIILTTIAVRASMLPFSVIQARHVDRLMKARPELSILRQHLRARLDELPSGAIRERTRKISIFLSGARGIMGLYRCHPLGLVAAPLTNIPVFVTFVWATRGMMRSGQVAGLSSDSSGALPLAAVACTYISTEISMGSKSTGLTKTIKDVLQSLVILSLPFAVTLPQGVFLYWIPSSIFTAAQITAMRNPSVRRVLGLQPISSPHSPSRPGQSHATSPGDTSAHKLKVLSNKSQAGTAPAQ